ncbi:MAG: hypothetical protein ACRD0P_24905 [Stackebrandtia sp.]
MSNDTPTHCDVVVELADVDGNVFAVVGRIARSLRQEGRGDAAAEFTEAACSCSSYDEVLQLAMRTVTIT